MGRNAKIGLDYFPMDIDFFSDIKIRKLIKYQGGKAISVYAYLLCSIYKDGYYIRWDNELPFIISEITGFDEAYIHEVLKCCFNIGIFNKELYEKEKIITSIGIQKRYETICNQLKRKKTISQFKLIPTEEPNEIPSTPIQLPEAKGDNQIEDNEEKTEKSTAKRSKKPPLEKVTETSTEKEAKRKVREKEFIDELAQFKGQYERQMLIDFFKYWSEPNRSGSKMRFELERTWDLKKRLSRWQNNDDKWNKTQLKPNTNESIPPLPSGVIEKLQK